MRKYLPFLGFVLFLSGGCVNGKSSEGVWMNGKIDGKIRTAIAGLDKQVFDDMCANNYPALSQLFSDTLKTMIGNDFEMKFMPQMQKVMKGRPYKMYDEFYVKNSKKDSLVTINSGNGDNAYEYQLLPVANETYVSMMIAGDSVNEVMLTVIYGNFKGAWKVSVILGEDYSLIMKNALSHYNRAHKLLENGDLVDAVNTMGVALHCATPGGNHFNYKKAGEMKHFSDSISGEARARYMLPYL